MLDVARQQACIRVVCKVIKYGDQCTSNIIVTAPCSVYTIHVVSMFVMHLELNSVNKTNY